MYLAENISLYYVYHVMWTYFVLDHIVHAGLLTQCQFTLSSGTLEQDRAILSFISNFYDKSQCVQGKRASYTLQNNVCCCML